MSASGSPASGHRSSSHRSKGSKAASHRMTRSRKSSKTSDHTSRGRPAERSDPLDEATQDTPLDKHSSRGSVTGGTPEDRSAITEPYRLPPIPSTRSPTTSQTSARPESFSSSCPSSASTEIEFPQSEIPREIINAFDRDHPRRGGLKRPGRRRESQSPSVQFDVPLEEGMKNLSVSSSRKIHYEAPVSKRRTVKWSAKPKEKASRELEERGGWVRRNRSGKVSVVKGTDISSWGETDVEVEERKERREKKNKKKRREERERNG